MVLPFVLQVFLYQRKLKNKI